MTDTAHGYESIADALVAQGCREIFGLMGDDIAGGHHPGAGARH